MLPGHHQGPTTSAADAPATAASAEASGWIAIVSSSVRIHAYWNPCWQLPALLCWNTSCKSRHGVLLPRASGSKVRPFLIASSTGFKPKPSRHVSHVWCLQEQTQRMLQERVQKQLEELQRPGSTSPADAELSALIPSHALTTIRWWISVCDVWEVDINKKGWMMLDGCMARNVPVLFCFANAGNYFSGNKDLATKTCIVIFQKGG